MSSPNVFVRLLWSLLIFFRFVFDGRFGGQVLAAWKGQVSSAPSLPVADSAPAPPKQPKKNESASALHLLAILQREGRLVDFLQEDISSYSDSEVGGAARLVHDGCRQVLSEYVALEPLRSEGEGARITVEPGFDPAAVRLTGQVTGQPPFSGALRHHGWKATHVKLPEQPNNVDPSIVAPAEVEL